MFSKICCLFVLLSCFAIVLSEDQVTLADLKSSDDGTDSGDPPNKPDPGPVSGGGTFSDDKTNNEHDQTSSENDVSPKHPEIIDGGSNCTSDSNDTSCQQDGQGITHYLSNIVSNNKDMLMRTFYVLISLTVIILIYFVVRTIRTRRRQNRTKRYGLLSTRDDNIEMTPLDADDDEDDLTVFDINNRK